MRYSKGKESTAWANWSCGAAPQTTSICIRLSRRADNGIEYLHETYGPEAVREYLRQFVRPITPRCARRSQPESEALKEHFERMYAVEGGSCKPRWTVIR
jgi:hypothetical protein